MAPRSRPSHAPDAGTTHIDNRPPISLGQLPSPSSDHPPEAPRAVDLPQTFQKGVMYQVVVKRPVRDVVPMHDLLPGASHLVEGSLLEQFRDAISTATPT
jgi:hypothetical protein